MAHAGPRALSNGPRKAEYRTTGPIPAGKAVQGAMRAMGFTRLALVLATLLGLAAPAHALDKVKFGTNWLADPAAGGFYQALADGTYAKYGLDVTIVPGGPQSNGGLLLLFGKLDFFMGGDMIGGLLSAESKLPLVAVAAIFQKSPQILMSHPGVGLDRWEDLPNAKPVYLGAGAINTFYAWLRLAYGFRDENVRPYNFNSAPFIANPQSIQQGYVSAEPYEIERQGGFKPNVFLLSDHGYSTYATLIVTRNEIVAKSPDVVQRFVDASIVGWRTYLYGDNSAGNAAIRQANPDITEGQIAFAVASMKEHGIVDSGDATKLGIGAMTDDRWRDFFGKMVQIGLVGPKTDYRTAYTLSFVNKGVGLDAPGK
jgi:NitT/TauT family transport system substrate-binding protein